jgi:hypothetical protein
LKLPQINEVNRGADDAVGRTAGGGEDGFEIIEGTSGFRGDSAGNHLA